MKLVFKYSLFALFATFCNLFFQYLSLSFYHGVAALYIAIIIGTFSGLVIKYYLDKKYIFYYVSQNNKAAVQKIIIYGMMGVFTTLIFWSTEITFHHLFKTEYAKYLGALIGLSVGYMSKYHLDKKYVFVHS